MLYEEISFIFLYVAAFGFSDFFIKRMKIKGNKLLIYYFVLLCIGIIGTYVYVYPKHKKLNSPFF